VKLISLVAAADAASVSGLFAAIALATTDDIDEFVRLIAATLTQQPNQPPSRSVLMAFSMRRRRVSSDLVPSIVITWRRLLL